MKLTKFTQFTQLNQITLFSIYYNHPSHPTQLNDNEQNQPKEVTQFIHPNEDIKLTWSFLRNQPNDWVVGGTNELTQLNAMGQQVPERLQFKPSKQLVR